MTTDSTPQFITSNGETITLGDSYWYLSVTGKLYSIKLCSWQDVMKGVYQFKNEQDARNAQKKYFR